MKKHSLALALLLPLTVGTLSAQSTTAPTLDVTAAGYATYYNGTTPYTMPQGLTGIIVTGNEGSTLTLTDQYQSGDYVPAGTPLLLKGAEGSYTLANPFTETTTVEVKQSTGAFSGTGTFHSTWASNNDPKVTLSTGANNMKFDGQGNIEAYSGRTQSSVYTISAAAGYYLVNSTLTVKTAVSGKTVTLTTGDKTYTVSDDAQTISLGATNTFTLSGENTGVTLSDFTVTLAEVTPTSTVNVSKETGSFDSGTGNFHWQWTSTNEPQVKIEHSAYKNNMTYDSEGNIIVYSGNPVTGTFNLSAVKGGYTVTGFSFAAKNNQTGKNVTITVNGTAYTMSDEAQTITGTNSFTVTGDNTGAVLSNFTISVAKVPAAATGNLLKGTDVEATTTATGDNNFYKLALDDETKSKVGFYWGEANGGAFQNGAHRAYLALPKSSSARIKGFALEGSVTGINGITTTETANKAVYTLDGRRVSNGTKLPAGLYIVGGKKVIIK